MPQIEPVPPTIGRLNLGIILETPFLHQTLMLPKVFNTTVESTALPNKTSEGSSTYTFLGPELVLNVFENETSEKRTEYHYTPSDPAEMIAAIEKEIAKLKVERKAVKEKIEAAAYKNKIKLLELDIKKLKRMKKQGVIPMKLVRTSFHEKRIKADIDVDGETIFEYEGPNIVKGTSTSTTTEDPPQVTEVIRTYKYNFLGQLVEMDLYGSLTKYTYDPLFRLCVAECNFVSPMGDFVSKDKTVYTYAPPGSDPIPANALIASVTDAYSGPEMEMDKVSMQPGGEPSKSAGGLSDAAQGVGGLEATAGSLQDAKAVGESSKPADGKLPDLAQWGDGLEAAAGSLQGAKAAGESSKPTDGKLPDLAQMASGLEAAAGGLQGVKAAGESSKPADGKLPDSSLVADGLEAAGGGLQAAKAAVESSKSVDGKLPDLAQEAGGLEAAAGSLQDAKAAVGEQAAAMTPAGKKPPDAAAVAAAADAADPCAALALLEFEFEMPKVTITKVVGTYVYGG